MMNFFQPPQQTQKHHEPMKNPPYFSIFLFFNSGSGSGVGQQLGKQ